LNAIADYLNAMKILMVIDSLDKGGKERRMLELIKGLLRRPEGFNIYLVSLTETVEYNYVYNLPIKFEILSRKYRKDPTIVLKLKKIIKTFKPDIIHSWSTMASIYLSLSNLWGRKPLINAVLADAQEGLNTLDKHYLRVKLTSPFSSVFVANSKAGIKSYRTPLHKSICIYNGIDFNRFQNLRPKTEVETDILGKRKDKQFVVAMVASFDERKDFATLLKAASRMCKKNKSLIFLLIGAGPTWETLRNSVPSDLLDNQIILTGKRDDVESVLQIVDVGVLITNASNHGEGISNAIIECMALGKPVIASRGGGTGEVVLDDFNGFLVDPKNEDQIIKYIELLYNDRQLLSQLGENAFKWVRENFDLEKKTDEYVDLYQKLKPANK
jgi:glycosyltransferase involved in cell wall biosynthesis